MVGLDLLFKWSAGQGGWARGRIVAVADEKDRVGGDKANFKVFYPSDEETACHRLMIRVRMRSMIRAPPSLGCCWGKLLAPQI